MKLIYKKFKLILKIKSSILIFILLIKNDIRNKIS